MKLLDAVAHFENEFNWTSGPTRNNESGRVWCSAGRIEKHTVRLYYYRGLKSAETQDAIMAVLIVLNGRQVYKFELTHASNDMKNVAASIERIGEVIEKVQKFFKRLKRKPRTTKARK